MKSVSILIIAGSLLCSCSESNQVDHRSEESSKAPNEDLSGLSVSDEDISNSAKTLILKKLTEYPGSDFETVEINKIGPLHYRVKGALKVNNTVDGPDVGLVECDIQFTRNGNASITRLEDFVK
jgi:hypothetical protein